MKNIGIAIRSLFKRGQHNVMKIISLGIGLTIGLVLIANCLLYTSDAADE